MFLHTPLSFFFFFNDTATTEIYTLSLHDALPILLTADGPSVLEYNVRFGDPETQAILVRLQSDLTEDRKSTRLNSSHLVISYAVFCLKKKKQQNMRSMSYSTSIGNTTQSLCTNYH